MNHQGIQMSCTFDRPIWTLLSLCVAAAPLSADEVEAFTEPYKQVAVPAAEIGVIAEVFVEEGDEVTEKQILATLDDSILQSSLLVAKAAMDAVGGKQSAETEVTLRKKHLESYEKLQGHGNATQRELDRAESEYQQSLARLQSVREDLEVRRLEYLRVKSQIKHRVIEAPIDGHVVSIVKEVGEFVSPTDPIVLHVAHLKSLKVVFSAPLDAKSRLQPGNTVDLEVGYESDHCQGVIEFVSPIADAESSTVRVKIRIPNADGTIQSGVSCRWNLNSQPPAKDVAGNAAPERNRSPRVSSKRVPTVR